MSSWASWFGGKRAPPTKDATRETIVELRQHLLTMEKKDDFLTKKIEEETQKAKNALLTGGTNGKAVATAALRRKKTHEAELEKLYGMRATIEAQVNAIENANMNMETMNAMKRGKDILKGIHGNLNIDKVEQEMEDIREQMELGAEISAAISNPVAMGQDMDEDELRAELEELEQETLDAQLEGAHPVPMHSPGSKTPASRLPSVPTTRTTEEEDEDAELRELQAALAA
ncbi:hypothetical protein P389DRAFT_43997 [Cystobasidium minutum MCA 4210]|uniref:uncharacterized protein n=1 Tax=Cystobasidium minutum MCA 4210 TaxID=1397322 RepID=UPI0034CDBD2C|eukprot:jgi/Rhomi1/43997/CE43996_4532